MSLLDEAGLNNKAAEIINAFFFLKIQSTSKTLILAL